MAPDKEDQIFAKVLELVASVAELNQKVERVQAHIESQGHNIVTVRDEHATIRVRLGDHTERLTRLEDSHTTHAGWRSRIGGLAVGVTATIALIGSLFAIWRSWGGR